MLVSSVYILSAHIYEILIFKIIYLFKLATHLKYLRAWKTAKETSNWSFYR